MSSTDKRHSSAASAHVLISYARVDHSYLEEFLTFLDPSIGLGLDVWYDDRIAPGVTWEREIRENLATCPIAVLLVTAKYFAADYVRSTELPLILARARAEQLRLLWIAIDHADIMATGLREFQALNDPERPLITLAPGERSQAWVEMIGKIRVVVSAFQNFGPECVLPAASPALPPAPATERRTTEPKTVINNITAKDAGFAIGNLKVGGSVHIHEARGRRKS